MNVRIPLYSYKTVLLGVIEPMTCPASYDQPMQLIGLDPNQLINAFVPPFGQAFSPQLHCSSRHPQKDNSFVL